MNDKLILTDCDGVLLDWKYRFAQYMEDRGYTPTDDFEQHYNIHNRYIEVKDKAHATEIVTEFNESARIGWLPPLRDAMKYVKKLHEEHGYLFGVITSLSSNVFAGYLRQENLARLFGDTCFEFVTCLDTGADKDEDLLKLSQYKKYKNAWWIEDKPVNLHAGVKVGFKGILMEHGHNMNIKIDGFVAKNWEDIYNHITSQETAEPYSR